MSTFAPLSRSAKSISSPVHHEFIDTDTAPIDVIAANAMTELFQEFHQLEKGDGKRYDGTGIGLALSRRLARALGGEIEARSRENEGSTFTLVLPRVVPPMIDPVPSQRSLAS